MELFFEEELRRKSYYEMYQIALKEKLIEVYLQNPTREELINILMKYRGVKANYTIASYKENGLANIQHLFDEKLSGRIHHENKIKIPHKIIYYKGLNLTREDNYKIQIPDGVGKGNIFLVNSNNYVCGIFHLEKDLVSKDLYYLISKDRMLRVDNLKSNKYSFIFLKEEDLKFTYKFYNMKKNGNTPSYPYKLNYYKVEIEDFEVRELEETNATLCIDFGTTNTALGTYLDSNYIKNVPTNDILNEKITLNAINYVKFDDGDRKYREIFPTLAYVEDCFDKENIKFLFGYDALKKLEMNDYVMTGSLFYGLKNWVHNYKEEEKIVDEYGNTQYVKREKIIKAYLDYVVKRAEYQFKCKFKRIHASSPVKLKEQFLNLFEEIFTKDEENEYEIVKKNSMDEAIAVLYNTIENQIRKGKYEENEEYSALIIDCGGGTTDLAACKYRIENKKVFYYLDIKTSFENGDENFGGNNLTYRIMQYLKIVLATKYSNKKSIKIRNLIKYNDSVLYKAIDEYGVDKIFEKMDEMYKKCEKIIPTKYSKFENKMSDEYKKIKNNFYMLWEAAENLKKEFFTIDGRLRTRFDIEHNYDGENDLHITKLKTWKLHILNDRYFNTITTYPREIFTIKEIEKIVKIDIYGMLRKFLNTYYNEGALFDYSLIKLSGQSTKINTFQEVLKEFVPGKMIEYRELMAKDNYDLKLNCLDGCIKYLNYKKFGHMEVSIKNEVPLVPYSVWTEKYNGEMIELIRTARKAQVMVNYIDKSSSAMEFKVYVHNAEGEKKKELVYKNINEYDEKDAVEILFEYEGILTQNDTDTIQNEITRFFIYTDLNNWGFYIVPIKRTNDQLFLGKKKYFSYENNLNDISYFDGEH